MTEPLMRRPPIRDVRVVVPVRDEEQTLGACLSALTDAMNTLQRADEASCRNVRVSTFLVLDTCRDTSARIAADAAARDARIHVIERTHGSVGMARRDGVRVALSLEAPHDAHALDIGATWIASTDADSTVPADWLTKHLEFANDGVDLLLGTVLLAPDPENPAMSARWFEGYESVEGHPHVHGANLGIRASTYVKAGEFPASREHEDVGLVAAVAATGAIIRSSARLPIVTSARRVGRTPGGFASFLSDLCGPGLRPRDNRDTTIVRSF
ncbi:glycosyltransferase [Pseudoclavibacter sp. AY1F1]|uniref:glycosyltransferase n=1 Tax=Pseudoclavibacter sp. AY1F1 TaxID=2080583 RepID=UPI0015E2CB45|nr:glycosyltransferase [Pseudoclavibacter sp. AY1F1]